MRSTLRMLLRIRLVPPDAGVMPWASRFVMGCSREVLPYI